jgi:hypothetical protein
MPLRRTAAQRDAILIRQAKAVTLRSQRLTFRQIAEELRVSSRQAFKDVQAGLKTIMVDTRESVDQARALEVGLMDRLTRAHVPIATGGQVPVPGGRPGETMNVGPDFKSSLIVIKASERRAKVMGLDEVDFRKKLDLSRLTTPEVEVLINLLNKATI